MKKTHTILKQTLLALSAGLFTGGVVTSIVAADKSFEILSKVYLPALLFYEFYVTLNVIDSESAARKNLPLIVVNFLIVILSFLILF